ADGAVIATARPKLAVDKVTDVDGDPVRYWFRGTPTADPETGARVIDSGWILPAADKPDCTLTATTCAFTVAEGALADGLTYSWRAWTYDGASDWTASDWVRAFTVDLHLGAADPLPRDSMGPAQVNLASGNVVVGTSSPTFASVGGPVGLTYTYNSGAPPAELGLVGSYYADPGATRSFAGLAPAVVRVDPNVNFEWATAPPVSPLGATDYLVRWEGSVATPTIGAYRFGASSDDGVRIWVDNQLVVDRWVGQNGFITPSYSSPIQMTAGQTKPIKVEYFQAGGWSLLHLVFLAPGDDPAAKVQQAIPPSWLTHPTGPLPRGWTLAPAGAPYAGARLSDRALTLTDASGSARSYPWSGAGAGFVPAHEDDAVAAQDTTGKVSVHGAGGTTTTFDAWGGVASVSDPTQDGVNTATQYTWSTGAGRPRLVSMRDPHSGRIATLTYGTAAPAGDPCPSALGYDRAPADMLCKVAWWDSTYSELLYKGSPAPQLARILDPGGAVTAFGYDAGGRMETIRSPREADAVGAVLLTGALDDDTSRTKVTYDGTGRAASVTLARPTPTAAQPAHTYEYLAERDVEVHASGLSEPQGFARHLVWDEDPGTVVVVNGAFVPRILPPAPAIRGVTDTDVNNLPTTAVYDWGDRPVSATDPTGRRAGSKFNTEFGTTAPPQHLTGRPMDGWGSGPAACMGENGTPVLTCGTTVAHADALYDVTFDAANPLGFVWTGLAATLWANKTLSAQPQAHTRRVPPALVPSALPAGLSAGDWSARYTGDLAVTTAGAYGFSLSLNGSGRLFVDDVLVVDAWSSPATTRTVASTPATVSLAAAKHRIRLDYAASGTSPTLELRWSGPAGTGAIPAANLAPATPMPPSVRPTTTPA
ncbi:MAG: hypothetical protein LC708_00050, partial [Actinobacteria bacterium]|nr:hypothetical protein [Actinomycetota bacterium]